MLFSLQHLGTLKAKLARYRAELLEGESKSGGKGAGFDIAKSGYGRIALIGFPSVGTCSQRLAPESEPDMRTHLDFDIQASRRCCPNSLRQKVKQQTMPSQL